MKPQPQLITLPKYCDPRGNLSVLENGARLPFDVKRAYWIYDVPSGRKRDGHAFRTQHELIIALSGSFDIVINDGNAQQRFRMDRANVGLYVPPLTWREIDNFSTNSVALIVASESYDADDYIEDFDTYLSIIHPTII